MKSEKDIQRYINILKKNPNSAAIAHSRVLALEWVLKKDVYPTERDLNILEETYKDNK